MAIFWRGLLRFTYFLTLPWSFFEESSCDSLIFSLCHGHFFLVLEACLNHCIRKGRGRVLGCFLMQVKAMNAFLIQPLLCCGILVYFLPPLLFPYKVLRFPAEGYLLKRPHVIHSFSNFCHGYLTSLFLKRPHAIYSFSNFAMVSWKVIFWRGLMWFTHFLTLPWLSDKSFFEEASCDSLIF